MTNNWKKYILWFAQEHVDFRNAEINSIVKLFGLQFRKVCQDTLKPFWIVELPNDEAANKLASRSVSLRGIFELWSHAGSLNNFHDNLRSYVQTNQEAVSTFFDADISFKITVETYNKHLSQKEKIDRIESFDYLPLKGSVELKSPQVEWWYIEFWGLDPKDVPNLPDDLMFGRLVGHPLRAVLFTSGYLNQYPEDSNTVLRLSFLKLIMNKYSTQLFRGQRHLIKELSLKKRKFIGNTSMDPQLSLLMANQALVRNGDLVFDPFVGTGSLLVSSAIFGGYVLGADIDFMMVHARSRPSRISQKVREKDESIRTNLRQYGCAQRYVDVLVSDFSNPLWRKGLTFDSIITDPPYGIREATERVENKTSVKSCIRSEDMPHYPSTSHYSLQELYSDLLIFAVKHLKLGGRLVCWIPFHREDYTEQMLPMHSCLNLVANSEQTLTGLTSRRLLTYEKIKKPLGDEAEGLRIDDSRRVELPNEFRERYFDNGLESRTERRQRRAELRELGRQEALKRGKLLPEDAKLLKCYLNKARFSKN